MGKYLELTGRSAELRSNVVVSTNAQLLWRRDEGVEPQFGELIELDLASIDPSVAEPNQPNQRQSLANAAA